MSRPSWPTATVPEKPEYSGYRDQRQRVTSSFQPDVGPPTHWRRSSLDFSRIQAGFVWTTTQRDAFYTFYNTTLQNGTLPFLWTNPAYGSEKLYVFDTQNPPEEEAVGYDVWRITVSVYRLN